MRGFFGSSFSNNPLTGFFDALGRLNSGYGLEEFARSKGFLPGVGPTGKPGFRQGKNFFGAEFFNPLTGKYPGNPGGNGVFLSPIGKGILDVLERDLRARKEASEQNRLAVQRQIGNVQQSLSQARSDLAGFVKEKSPIFDEIAAAFDALQEMGPQPDAFEADAAALQDDLAHAVEDYKRGIDKYAKGLRKVDSGVDEAAGFLREAARLAKEAIARGDRAISEFKDRSLASASAAAQGIRRAAMQQLEALASGVGPNGVPISESERRSLAFQVQMRAGEQVQQAVAPFMQATEETLAQLKMGTAALAQQASQIMAGIGRTRGELEQVRLAGIQTGAQMETLKFQAEQGLAAFGLDVAKAVQEMRAVTTQIRQSVLQNWASARTAQVSLGSQALNKAVDLELQGGIAIAELIKSNPIEYFSVFEGLLTFLTMNETFRKLPS